MSELVHVHETDDELVLTYYDPDAETTARVKFVWVPAIGTGVTIQDDRSERDRPADGYWALRGTGSSGRGVIRNEVEGKAVIHVSRQLEAPVYVPQRSTSRVARYPGRIIVKPVRSDKTHVATKNADATLCGQWSLPTGEMKPTHMATEGDDDNLCGSCRAALDADLREGFKS